MGDLKSLARRHAFVVIAAITALIWEFAVNLALQKGFLDNTPNWVCFWMLAGPVFAWTILALAHPETRKRYYLVRVYKLMTFVIFIFSGALLGGVVWFFFFITHPIHPSENQAPPPINGGIAKKEPARETSKTEPAPPSLVSSSQMNKETVKQFETNTPSTGINEDAESELNKAKIQKRAEIEARDHKNGLDNQSTWKNNLPLFNHSLESLYDNLNIEAAKRGDSIKKISGYFGCLPSTIDFKMEETDVTEIAFDTETNLHFIFAITKGSIVGSTIQPNGLKIKCSCGFLELQPFWFMSGNHLHRIIHIPGYDDDTTNDSMSIDKSRELIEKGVKILIAAQIDYLTRTNKQ